VLPVLYILFETKKVKVKPNHIGLVLLLVAPVFSFGQQQELNGFVDQAISNNKGFKASENEVKYAEALTGSAYTITQPTVYFSYDENNIAANGKPLQVFGVRQSFNFPTIYGAQKQLYKAQEATASQANSLQKLVLVKDITQAYYSVVYHQEKLKTYAFLDSIYTNFSKAATKRFQVGESNLIEKLTAEAQQEEIAIQMQQTSKDLATALQQLKSYVQPQENEEVLVTLDSLPKLTQKPITIEENAGMLLLTQKSQVAAQQLKLQKQQLLPDIEFSVFQGSNTAPDAQNYWGVEAGLSIPIWFSSNKAKVKAAKIEVETVAYQQEEYAIRLQNLYDGLQNDLAKYEAVVNYYEKTGNKLSAQLTKAASQSYKHGEIDFFQYIQLLEKAKQIQLNYLDNLHTYNQTIIELNYLTY
jgi:cobalt-zinc-cadmium resistance protein CzcA